MVTSEVRLAEEEKRVIKTIGQTQQEVWTTWDKEVDPKITWSNLWSMDTLKINMLFSLYVLLLMPANGTKWKLTESRTCLSCGKHGMLEHILANYDKSLT